MAVTILEVDDWTALYRDGRLVHQTHSLHARDILEACGAEHEYRWLEFDDAVVEFGNDDEFVEFPDRLPDAS